LIFIKRHLSLPAAGAAAAAATASPPSETSPIDFTSFSTITGDESQILQVRLFPNQILRAESGSMLYMTDGVHMETSLGLNSNSSALSTGMTRLLTGQNLMISDFTYSPPPPVPNNYVHDDFSSRPNYGTVCLTPDFPAKILKLQLNHYPNSTVICQKGAYMAGSHSVIMEMAFTKTFTSGFFGGEGFVLQKLRSSGGDDDYDDATVFLKAYGTVVKKTLRPNERLRISSGCLVAMTFDIDYDVTIMSGFKNVLFGGEGLFVTTLTGPGTVWLQGMSIDRMVSEIARRVPSGGGGIGLGVPIFGGGSGSGEEAATATEGVASDDAANDNDTGAPLSDSIASSGMISDSSSSSLLDPESSESLFGDAAYGGGENAPPASLESTSSSTDGLDFAKMDGDDVTEFEESTVIDEFEQFEDDDTTFSTYDRDASKEGGLEETPATLDEAEGGSLLSRIWGMFKDWNDDD
jgi:uncharacterized protein (AIM24 family)